VPRTIDSPQLAPRERRALAAARAVGYLDARRATGRQIARPYALWCWRLKIPLVWFDRRSPRSKYGRLRLDLFTTANRLTEAGQMVLQDLGARTVSPHDASWERVLLSEIEALAAAVLRTALRDYELNDARVTTVRRREPARLLELPAARSA